MDNVNDLNAKKYLLREAIRRRRYNESGVVYVAFNIQENSRALHSYRLRTHTVITLDRFLQKSGHIILCVWSFTFNPAFFSPSFSINPVKSATRPRRNVADYAA